MNTTLIDGIGNNLKALKLTPVSDTDRTLLAMDVAKRITTPYGWTGWALDTYRPILDRRFDEAIKNGVQTYEVKQQYMKQLDTAIIRRALHKNTDYPMEKLRKGGINSNLIDQVKAKYEIRNTKQNLKLYINQF